MAERRQNFQRSTSNFQLPTEAHSPGTDRPVATPSKYDLEERLLNYAARIVRLTNKLPRTRAGNHVAKQLLKSGTSPFPNHGEAQASESAQDFIHKMRICLKELRESSRWLRLIGRVPLLKNAEDARECRSLITETQELIKIFYSSIRTAQRNRGNSHVPVD